MGWIVVQIGLGHDLPIDDPFETAKVVAERMNRNIKLVYWNEYEYDVANNVATVVDHPYWIELGSFDVNGSDEYLRMEVCHYQANKIKETVGIDNIRESALKNEYGEWLIDDIEDSFVLYEIEDVKIDISIAIFKENIDLGINILDNWDYWESVFHLTGPEDFEYLHNYRMQIYNTARMFGCSEVIICADQGPTEFIYDRKNRSADSLKEYVRSFQYLKDYGRAVENFDIENWKKNAKHISFSSYFKNDLILSKEDFIEVVFDDFGDIVQSL